MKILNLRKTYPLGRGNYVLALKGLDLDLPETGMVFILGKSGSGKSTLLKLLAGLEKPSDGEIYFHGKNLATCSVKELDSYRNTYCGFIFQEYNLIPELNVGDNIALALQMQGDKETKEKVEEVLRQVDLEGYEKRRVSELSGGQRQRVAIARAIIKDPEIIFADEPTGALDQKTGNAVFSLLKELSKEHLILAVTHDREFAEKYGDRIIELQDGEILGDAKSSTPTPERGEEETPYEIKKTKLPFKVAVKVGGSNFKEHVGRMIAALFLSVVSLFLFSVMLTVALWDNEKAFFDAVYENNIQYYSVSKRIYHNNGNYLDQSFDRFFGYKDDELFTNPVRFTNEELETLQSFLTPSLVQAYPAFTHYFQTQRVNRNLDDLNMIVESTTDLISVTSDGFLYMTEDALQEFGFSIVGRLPHNDTEIAIPDDIFNMYKYLGGFIDEDETTHLIEREEDIIGLKIKMDFSNPTSILSDSHYVTITGVVRTNCTRDCNNQDDGFHQTFHNHFFVCKEVMDQFESNPSILFLLPEDKNEFISLFKYVDSYSEGEYTYALSGECKSIYQSAEGGIVTVFQNIAMDLGILFLIVSEIFFVNFISVSIRRQMKEIGILSAMGMNTKGIIKIYGSVTGALCLAAFVFSYALSWIAGIFINSVFSSRFGYQVALFQFHLLVPIALLAILAAVAAIGCLIPIFLYKRKHASELINRGLVK